MNKIKCWFLGHDWDKYSSWWQEKPHYKDNCKRCGVKCEDTITTKKVS